MEEEIWLPIIGYEKFYCISSHGRVKRLKRTVLKKLMHCTASRHYPEKIMSPEKTRNGYLRITLSGDSLEKRFLLHRLIAMHFLNDFKEHLQVNHKDGIKHNNFYKNLEMSTPKQNMQHASKVLGVMKGLGRRRKIFDTETGIIYDCIKDASVKYKKQYSQFHITNMLSGRRKNKTTFIYYEK